MFLISEVPMRCWSGGGRPRAEWNRMLRALAQSSVLRSGLEVSDTKVHEPSIRALLGTSSDFCEAVVLQLKIHPATAH